MCVRETSTRGIFRGRSDRHCLARPNKPAEIVTRMVGACHTFASVLFVESLSSVTNGALPVFLLVVVCGELNYVRRLPRQRSSPSRPSCPSLTVSSSRGSRLRRCIATSFPALASVSTDHSSVPYRKPRQACSCLHLRLPTRSRKRPSSQQVPVPRTRRVRSCPPLSRRATVFSSPAGAATQSRLAMRCVVSSSLRLEDSLTWYGLCRSTSSSVTQKSWPRSRSRLITVLSTSSYA